MRLRFSLLGHPLFFFGSGVAMSSNLFQLRCDLGCNVGCNRNSGCFLSGELCK
ncbi:hypothetical protein KC19_5G130600 [Ceratodon purpureus]|uniref:Uncharacterized protein n=1 Tax=Ceratodon purpureus TaxID=3225 RepID=A0A8T0I3H6_CERPU|nr:hypothetical protein KC19_5G130600 [Ceratodon purpureus]